PPPPLAPVSRPLANAPTAIRKILATFRRRPVKSNQGRRTGRRIPIAWPLRGSVQRESILSAPPASDSTYASPPRRSTQDRFLNVRRRDPGHPHACRHILTQHSHLGR